MLKNSKFQICTLLSSILFVLMFPIATGENAWPIETWSCLLAWVYLVPIWFLLRHQPSKRILFWGYLFCLLSTLGALYWFYIAMKKYGEMPGWQSLLILIAAGLLVGTIRWFAFLITSRFQSIRHFPLFAACVFTLIEWSMMYIPFEGFPWITPGYAILPMNHLIQTVDLFGVIGINFFIFYTNFALVEFFTQKQKGLVPQKKTLLIMITILILGTTYGIFQIKSYETNDNTEKLNISLLQGNISQDIKWSPEDRETIIQTYQELSMLASNGKPDLIVWPEASLPKTINISRKEIEVIPQEITEGKFVIGAPTYFKENGKTHFQNSAFTLLHDGTIEHRYDKVRLVPFGEYIPNFGIIPIRKWVPAVAGDFFKGSIHQEMSHVKNHPFALFICFEVLFPDVARQWVHQGAQFFVNITNDAWFDRSSGPFQHLRFAAMRSIEFRKPLVRAANTGITTWFDATGAQHEQLDLFERGYITATIEPNSVRTIYAQFPNITPTILFMLTLCIMVMNRRKPV
jgi:apolipoprotein N-acyltransferase